MTNDRPRKITSLQIENFMRISAIEIRPVGNVVEITGENAQGKTSIMNAIWALCGGKPAIPSRPIRKGEKRAVIKAELGDLVVTRTINEKEDGAFTTAVTIEAADGARYSKPQDILNGFLNALSFDPLALALMRPQEQFETFRQFVTDVDLDAISAANDADYDQRTEVNRRVKTMKARLDGIVIPDDAPAELIDEKALVDQLEDAGQVNLEIERRRHDRNQEQVRIDSLRGNAETLMNQAADLRRQAEELEATAQAQKERAAAMAEALAKLGPLGEPVDTSAIRAELEEARRKNERYREAAGARAEFNRLNDEIAAGEKESDDLTKAMDARSAKVDEAIASSKLPVPGISFGDGIVMLNDLPFDQASQAEKLRASVAVAAALNPKLRMALVRDGSLLDKKSWKLLCDLADEFDFQIFVETVDSGRPGAVVIEDGHLAGATPTTSMEAAE